MLIWLQNPLNVLVWKTVNIQVPGFLFVLFWMLPFFQIHPLCWNGILRQQRLSVDSYTCRSVCYNYKKCQDCFIRPIKQRLTVVQKRGSGQSVPYYLCKFLNDVLNVRNIKQFHFHPCLHSWISSIYAKTQNMIVIN